MDVSKIAARLRAGLEGVTPGPWRNGTGVDDEQEVQSRGDFIIATCHEMPSSLGSNEANARHIANCDPENIRAILDDRERAWRNYNEELDNLRDRNEELDAAEARITQLEQELATAREAITEAEAHLYEVNMSNYDHDEVTRLNEGSVNACIVLHAFLTKDTPND